MVKLRPKDLSSYMKQTNSLKDKFMQETNNPKSTEEILFVVKNLPMKKKKSSHEGYSRPKWLH